MDVTSSPWFSQMEMDQRSSHEFNINQHQFTNPYFTADAMAAFSSETLTTHDHDRDSFQESAIDEYMPKQPECSYSFAPFIQEVPSSFIMSFGNHNSPHQPSHLKYSAPLVKPNKQERNRNTNEFSGCAKRVPGRNLTQTQDHVLAERKRRELLTQHFISLSSLLPNLKKMDKGSVLEDATKYIKQLQIRMKELEEETTKRFKQESAVSIKRCKILEDDGNGESCFNPEIEVRISESSVLVRILICSQQKTSSVVIMKTLTEMKKLHLTINCSSVIPFSTTSLLITITAQMSEERVVTAMDVVKSLQSVITKFIEH